MTIRNLVLGIATALVCSLSATAPVRADLEDTLRDMLDANVQVNNPGSISSARRGGFYGGSIYVRGRVMNVSVINFTPPSFSAGCGGIDLFGGSFSMINKEQFVALLRSVAQNAAGYAFHLALKNICEQCSTIIANLQRVIQEMNQFTGNSCQLAKGIVNGGLQALELSDVKGMQTTSMTSGFNDAWDAFWGSLSSTVDQLASTNADGSRDYDKFEVNVVWEAMRNNGVSGWFADGDSELMEALMTLTGTVVLSGPVDDDSGNPSRNVTPAVSGGGLSIRDLIFGNGSARILRCSNRDKCLSMTTNTVDLPGLERMLEEVLVGTGPTDTSSVLYRLTNGSGTTTDAETAIGQLGTYGSLLLSIAEKSDPGSTAAYTFFEEVKGYLAYELAVLFISDVISAVDQSVASNKFDTAYADEWRKGDFQRAIDRISGELKLVAEQTAMPTETLQTYMDVLDHLVRNYSPLR
jgi:conjugative transfer pilus assembly protein TraH